MLHQRKGLQASASGDKCVKHGYGTRCVTFSSRKQQQDVSRALLVSCRASSGSEESSSSSNISSGKPSVSVADPQVPVTGTNAAGAAAAAGGGTTGSASGAADKNAALAARIAAAKAYKFGSSSAAASPSSSSSSSSGDSPEQQSAPLSDAEQQAMRQQYLQQLQQQQQELAAQSSAYNSFLQQPSSSSSSDPLERLAAEDQGWGPGSKTGPARSDFYTSADAPEVQQLLSSAPKRQGMGSADEVADWLKGVLQDTGKPQIDSNLRMEDITLAKEAALKQRGAEIITAFPEDFASSSSSASEGGSSPDAAAAAAAADEVDEDGKYKPKVTTWGVFPRPQNISAAYGGGRNIRPGQDLETPQQKAQRETEYAAALAKYKAATFTDSISEEELAAAQARFNEGMKLFNRGVIDKALVIFDEVRAKVPLKSKLGGMSTLQAAVCYDTLGNGRQAEALYKRIQGHPTTEVGRKARQLVFGFQAMTFLKTEGLNYAVKKEDYLKYFRRSADRTRIYVASEEERIADAAEARKAAALAAGIVLGPVIMMGAMVLGK